MRGRHWFLGLSALVLALLVLMPDAPPYRAPLEAAAYTTDEPPADAWQKEPARSEPIREYTLVSGGFSLGLADAGSETIPLHVPDRTVSTLVTFTFQSGASHGFAFGLSGCHRDVGPLVAGDGTTVTYDCGPTTPGSQELVLNHRAGQLHGLVEVAVRVCPDRGPCPGPGDEWQ